MRGLLRRMASPVTVVTCWADGKPQGATIGSFASLSLNPPLVSFNVQRQGRFHAAITRADRFAVHALAADQAEIADRFATSGDDAQDLFVPTQGGIDVPLLAGTQGVLLCQPYAQHRIGDHTLLIGQVIEVRPGEGDDPLLYQLQGYRSLGAEPAGNPSGP
jgi:flavin reductase (DIM6/NTAB) family NADH-FMN oxidoreductase RutF